MIEPKKYYVNQNATDKMMLRNKFISRTDYYTIKKPLYGNYIFLNLLIDKSDYFLTVDVSDNNGYVYAPFYNPDDRHNNNVYEEMVKNYNAFMDKLTANGIFICESDDNISNNIYREDTNKENINKNKPLDISDTTETQTIKIKYFTDIEKIRPFSNGDLIDLRASQDIKMKKGDFRLIPLGVAMQLPKGYKANVYPRSSTYKNFGIILANSVGQIDESYCGDNDEWKFPAIALRDTIIHKNDRICQFEIQKKQPNITFEEIDILNNKNRGGLGSTGKN